MALAGGGRGGVSSLGVRPLTSRRRARVRAGAPGPAPRERRDGSTVVGGFVKYR